jgi:small subunit ribosomal protein S9
MPETPKKRTARTAPKREAKKSVSKSSARAQTPSAPETQEEVVMPPAPTAPAMSGEHTADEDAMMDAAALERISAERERYFEAVGRRKTATARVRMFTRSGAFTVNGKAYGEYFPTLDMQKIAEDALKRMKLWDRFRISAKVSGGGIHAQAEAVRHGLARCLIIFNPDFRKRMKRAGFLKRDPRMKERKKFGLKKARRAPQWAKR